MKPEIWNEIERHYIAASELEGRAQETYLARIEASTIRMELESLLKARPAEDFLECDALEIAARFRGKDFGEYDQPTIPYAALDETLIGSVIDGRYQIQSRIGRPSGMGEVYLAEHLLLKETVAVKRLASEFRADAIFRQRFLNEARRAVSLNHTNVVKVRDATEENGEVFVVMEYVQGDDLRSHMDEPYDIDEFLRVAIQCARALEAAHEKRIVHLDIKPENILMTSDGQVKICDFGIARRLDEDTEWTFGGTLPYMAPEVLRRDHFDERADLFSLGVVFYEMLAGYNPFSAGDVQAITTRICEFNPTALAQININVSPDLERLVAALLEKHPEERIASATAVVEQLEAIWKKRHWVADLGTALSESAREALSWARANRLGASALALLLALALAVFALVPKPAPEFAQRDFVLITDFENQAGDPVFGASLREGLSLALQQTNYLNVLPRQRIIESLQRMRKPANTPITEDVGREISLRENARAMVTGSIRKSGNQYQIAVRVADMSSGLVFVEDVERFERADQLFESIDKVAYRIRDRLGESMPFAARSMQLSAYTTSSTDALTKYSLAEDLYARGRLEEATQMLERVLELDASFAMAHRRLAHLYYLHGQRNRQLVHLDKAFELRKSVGERERFFIEANYYAANNQDEKAKSSLISLLSLYPDDELAHALLGEVFNRMGDHAKYVEELEQGLKLNPYSTVGYSNLAAALLGLGRYNDVLGVYERAKSKGVDPRNAHTFMAFAHLAQDNPAQALAEFARLREGGGFYERLADFSVGYVDLYEGKLNSAVDRYERRLTSDRAAGFRSFAAQAHYILARTYLLLNRRNLAEDHAKSILAEQEPREIETELLRRAGYVHAQLGDLAAVREILKRLEAVRSQTTAARSHAAYHNLSGELALAERLPDAAIDAFTKQIAAYADYTAQHGLARAYSMRGDWRQAVQAFQQVLLFKAEIIRDFPPDWTLSFLEMGRLYRMAGDDVQARNHYQRFIDSWKRGDTTDLYQQALRELQH